MVIEERKQEERSKWIHSAFIGFQMGAAGKMNFGEYLESLNLMPSTTPSAPKVTAKDIIAGAEETLRMMREKKEQEQ